MFAVVLEDMKVPEYVVGPFTNRAIAAEYARTCQQTCYVVPMVKPSQKARP